MVKNKLNTIKDDSVKPTREEAEAAIELILRYIGENPHREGLLETPKRVVKSYDQFFKGYKEDPQEILSVTFSELEDYEDIITLQNIDFESFCEHHMLPIIGRVAISYIPDKRVVGISKLARIVNVFSKRLQLQERMTAQIAKSIDYSLNPKGVAVIIEAKHDCIACRGIHKINTLMRTQHFIGCFKENETLQQRIISYI